MILLVLRRPLARARSRSALRAFRFRGQDYCKLLAAIAGDEVDSLPDSAVHLSRNELQTRVARKMPVAIVIAFEMIDVDDCQAERGARSQRPFPFAIEKIVETTAIGKFRQGIRYAERFEFTIRCFQCLRALRDGVFERGATTTRSRATRRAVRQAASRRRDGRS